MVCSLAYVARDTIVPYPAECTSEKETTAFDFVLPGHSNPFRLCFSMRSPYFPPTSKFRWLSAAPVSRTHVATCTCSPYYMYTFFP